MKNKRYCIDGDFLLIENKEAHICNIFTTDVLEDLTCYFTNYNNITTHGYAHCDYIISQILIDDREKKINYFIEYQNDSYQIYFKRFKRKRYYKSSDRDPTINDTTIKIKEILEPYEIFQKINYNIGKLPFRHKEILETEKIIKKSE